MTDPYCPEPSLDPPEPREPPEDWGDAADRAWDRIRDRWEWDQEEVKE